MKQISVIVPIYNVENYVKACFDSLLNQDFKDFQVVAVNDGSPANEQVIIDEYVNKYPDVFKSIVKENGGYGSVLQLAINTIDTPYFLVCDPDDTLADNALSTLYNLAINHNVDIVVGCKTYVYHNNDHQDYHNVLNTTYGSIEDKAIGLKNECSIEPFYFMDPSPHAKLYKTELAKKAIFPTKIAYTDQLLYFYSLSNANKVIYTSQSLAYYLVDRPNNSMSDMQPKAIEANMKVIESIIDNCHRNRSLNGMLAYRLFESFKWVIQLINQTTQDRESKIQQALNHYALLQWFNTYKSDLLPYYKKYTQSKFMEKYRDLAMINNNLKAYKTYINKTIK